MIRFLRLFLGGALLVGISVPARAQAVCPTLFVSPNPAYYGQAATVTVSAPATLTVDGITETLSLVNGLLRFSTSSLSAGVHTILMTDGGCTQTVILTVDPPATSATYKLQGPKLDCSGESGTTSYIGAVALSADGNTALVGSPATNSLAGAAWVFTRSNGVWTPQAKLAASDAMGPSLQGMSVALSADGNTALIGGPSDQNFVGLQLVTTGAAWIFTRSAGVWSQLGSKLLGTGANGNARQGSSVALSADGNTAILGGPSDGSTGAVWAFTRANGMWAQQGDKLAGSGAAGSAQQGTSVALSADGNTALVGGPSDGAGSNGASWVFTRTGGAWSQQGGKLAGTDSLGAALGTALALSADGNTALVSGFSSLSQSGALWVFARAGGVWAQQGDKFAVQTGGLSASADGNTILVAGQRIFSRSGNTWNQQGTRLAPPNASLGFSGALSADTSTLLLGGVDDHGFCAAWVFVPLSPSTITLSEAPGSGQVVTFTVSVTPGATGTVTFTIDGMTYPPVTLQNGQAQFAITSLAVGIHTVTAEYSGDANFFGSNSNVLSHTVTPVTVTLSSSANPSVAGQAVTFTATLSGGNGNYNGAVAFFDGPMSFGSSSVTNGQATLTTAALALGAHAILAQYTAGNIFTTESALASLTQTVTTLPVPSVSSAAANLSSSFAPDEIASLFNVAGLSGDTLAPLPLPPSLAGVTVTITDSAGVSRAAPISGVFASAMQVNFMIPSDAALGPATLAVMGPLGASEPVPIRITSIAPGIFTANSNGQGVFAGQVVHAHADGTQTIESSAIFDARQNAYAARPIDLGSPADQVFLVMYGTGIRHYQVGASMTPGMGGTNLPVVYAGPQGTWPGLDQINLQLPRSLAGAGTVNIVITVDAQAANPVTMRIQ